MHQVLSHKLWDRIRTLARKTKRRQAAIAYVTTDLISFRRNDLLIVDASESVIRSGGTNAKLLAKLVRKGVAVYSCPSLHAKVILLNDHAVIGSCNMSESSRHLMVEAALITDSPSIASGVASLIEQLRAKSKRLDARAVAQLAKIKVVRVGFGLGKRGPKPPKISDELGRRTWLTGTYQEDRELTEAEEELTDQSTRELARKLRTDEEPLEWIRCTGTGKFVSKCREGDQVIQIWKKSLKNKRPSAVLCANPILRKAKSGGSTFFFLRDGTDTGMNWGAFKNLMKRLGYRRRFGPGSEVVLEPELADAIFRNWKTA